MWIVYGQQDEAHSFFIAVVADSRQVAGDLAFAELILLGWSQQKVNMFLESAKFEKIDRLSKLFWC